MANVRGIEFFPEGNNLHDVCFSLLRKNPTLYPSDLNCEAIYKKWSNKSTGEILGKYANDLNAGDKALEELNVLLRMHMNWNKQIYAKYEPHFTNLFTLFRDTLAAHKRKVNPELSQISVANTRR